MDKIKQFKTMIPEHIQWMIITVIAAIFVIFSSMSQTRLLPLIGAIIASLSLAFIVIYLAVKKAFLLSYVIMFMIGFGQGLRNFFLTITSFWMNGFNFFGTFNIELIVALVVCIYLLLMIISYGIDQTFVWNKPSLFAVSLTLLFIGYIYLNSGVIPAMYIGFIFVLLCHYAPILSLLLILHYTIESPLQAIDRLFLGTAKFTSLHYWILSIYALTIIVLLVMQFMKQSGTLRKDL